MITGCINIDGKQQRMAGSSGVFLVGTPHELNIQQSDKHVRTKIFTDDITTCPGNTRECMQRIQVCQFKQMPKATLADRRESIFLTYCRIISLQWSLLCSLTETSTDHFDLSSFHSQGTALDDYQVCLIQNFPLFPINSYAGKFWLLSFA